MLSYPQPTVLSPDLLLSFPQEILQLIFTEYLLDGLENELKGRVFTRLRSRIIEFSHIVHITKPIRGVCRSWAKATRCVAFTDKSARQNLILLVPRLFTEREVNVFPELKDCMVRLCHPYWLDDLAAILPQLANLELSYICAIIWQEDDVMDVMRGRVGHLGYGRFEARIMETFVAEAIAAGVDIVDCNGKRSKTCHHKSSDDEMVEADAARAVRDFIFKESLALWYYNAQLVRQILSHFSCLTLLSMPDFLHLPLLADIKYFFPTFQNGEESSFSSISFAPPQMLQELGIKYRQQGRRYLDIMAPIEQLDLLTSHYNPILALLHGQVPALGPPTLWSLRVMNKWRSDTVDWDVASECRRMMKRLVHEAVCNIPDHRKPLILDTRKLMGIMDMEADPY